MNKQCYKCNLEKDINEFGILKKSQDGHRGMCKSCRNDIQKEAYKLNLNGLRDKKMKYFNDNKEVLKERRKDYFKMYNNREDVKIKKSEWSKQEEIRQRYKDAYHNDPEYRAKQEEKAKKYYEKNREYIIKKTGEYKKREDIKERNNAKIRHRLKTDINFRILHNMSGAIYSALKNLNLSKKGKHWENLVGYTVQDLKEHLEKQFKEGMSWNNYGKWHIDHIKPKCLFNITSYDCQEFKDCWALKNLQPLWAIDNLRKQAKF